MQFRIRLLIQLMVILAAAMASIRGPAEAASCTYYASPSGTGSGSSSSPFKIANFWSVAKAGHTLCLLDGQYTGSSSMINPPANLSGTASARITVRALNDGKVTLNGQGSLIPVRLRSNHYFIVEGINARNSAASVVTISQSSNNIIRRVAAWDAADGNHMIFGIHESSSHTLLEDVAGWGIARKIYAASQGGNFTTIRRAWGRWEGSHVVGPKMTYTMVYNNYNMIVENSIGTWSGERMKQTYTLLDYFGKPWTGNGAGTYTNHGVDQPYGIFGIDGITNSNKQARAQLLGSIAYVHGSDRFHPAQAVFVTKLDAIDVVNSVAYIQPGAHNGKRPFNLLNMQTATAHALTARNLTGIGSSGSFFGSEWKKSSVSEGSSLSLVGNVFTSSSGGNLCRRYKDGALTSEPLWPWPMNQRIINAMVESGRSSVDVTKVIEGMLGPIPAVCRSSGTGSSNESPSVGPSTPPTPTVSIPNAPTGLQVTP